MIVSSGGLWDAQAGFHVSGVTSGVRDNRVIGRHLVGGICPGTGEGTPECVHLQPAPDWGGLIALPFGLRWAGGHARRAHDRLSTRTASPQCWLWRVYSCLYQKPSGASLSRLLA